MSPESDAAEAQAPWSVKRLVTEVVGSGPKTADDMTRPQAIAGFRQILDGSTDPVTLGGFLMANRWKHNTPTELAAFVDVMRERIRSDVPRVDPVDCGANYDGKTETAVLGVAAGIVAAAAGTPVVAHSAGRIPTAYGATYLHVLNELGVPTDLPPVDSARMLDDIGFGFYNATRFNPAITRLAHHREAMGVRTFINTIETLANPAGAQFHLGSFFHLSFAERVIATIQESHSLDVDRVVMVQGLEGYDDIRTGRTRIAEWNGGDIVDFELRPTDYGIEIDRDSLDVSTVEVDSAQITEGVIAGERDDEFTDAVILNAAVRLWARQDVESLTEGLSVARNALTDGTAQSILHQLREFTPRGNG